MPSLVWLLAVVFAAVVCVTTWLLLVVNRENPDALQNIIFPERSSQPPTRAPSLTQSQSQLQPQLQPQLRPQSQSQELMQTQPLFQSQSRVSFPSSSASTARERPAAREERSSELEPPPQMRSASSRGPSGAEFQGKEKRFGEESTAADIAEAKKTVAWRAGPSTFSEGSTLSTARGLKTSTEEYFEDLASLYPTPVPETIFREESRSSHPPMEGWKTAPQPSLVMVGPSELYPLMPSESWGATLSTAPGIRTNSMTFSGSSFASTPAPPSAETSDSSVEISTTVSFAPGTPPPSPATGISMLTARRGAKRSEEWTESTAAAKTAEAAQIPPFDSSVDPDAQAKTAVPKQPLLKAVQSKRFDPLLEQARALRRMAERSPADATTEAVMAQSRGSNSSTDSSNETTRRASELPRNERIDVTPLKTAQSPEFDSSMEPANILARMAKRSSPEARIEADARMEMRNPRLDSSMDPSLAIPRLAPLPSTNEWFEVQRQGLDSSLEPLHEPMRTAGGPPRDTRAGESAVHAKQRPGSDSSTESLQALTRLAAGPPSDAWAEAEAVLEAQISGSISSTDDPSQVFPQLGPLPPTDAWTEAAAALASSLKSRGIGASVSWAPPQARLSDASSDRPGSPAARARGPSETGSWELTLSTAPGIRTHSTTSSGYSVASAEPFVSPAKTPTAPLTGAVFTPRPPSPSPATGIKTLAIQPTDAWTGPAAAIAAQSPGSASSLEPSQAPMPVASPFPRAGGTFAAPPGGHAPPCDASNPSSGSA